MKRRLSACLIAALFLLVLSPLAAQTTDPDRELWAYIQRQSDIWFQSYITEHGEVDPGTWQEPLETAFLRLASNSGQPGFSISYAVLQDKDFNAACFPGGQFIIHQGTLCMLDQIIEQELGGGISTQPTAKVELYRESLLAPVIAHELAHYYNRHTFASMKAQFSMAQLGEPAIDLKLITFSQENELDADKTGYLLLKRAGYDPDLMLTILELLNDIQQQDLASNPDASANVYLSSHPSPHARLSAFNSDRQALHAWAAGLEQAFSDIQVGRNLDKALAVVDQGLTLVPANVYLKKERAVVLHKKWLATVALKDQKIRGIIDSPAFRDEMVFSTRGSRGTERVLPGDRMLWLKAREAYTASYQQAVDPAYNSNFALLLAYSTDATDMKAAVQLAYNAAKDDGAFSNVSNLAAVLYVTDQTAAGLDLMTNIAAQFDSQYAALLTNTSKNAMVTESLQSLKEQMRLTQMLDVNYVFNNFTPLLNLALILTFEGQKQKAASVAIQYLANYESNSAWAQYLATMTGVTVPKAASRVPIAVNGLTVGSPLTLAVEKWGKANEIVPYDNGEENWSYAATNSVLTIRDGMVAMIELDSATSPRLANGLGVGSGRTDMEKAFGKPKRMSNSFTVYEGPQNIAILYVKEIAQQIVLFP